MLIDEQASPEQIAILRAMTGGQRLQLAEQPNLSARKLTAAGVRQRQPDWSEEQVNAEVQAIFSNARS